MSSDDDERTFTALEIVTEIFPATPRHLLPRPRSYRLESLDNGDVILTDRQGSKLLVLQRVPQAGNPGHRLSCDFCHHSAARDSIALMRLAVPRSDGRRWRYLSMCRDPYQCDARRHDDSTIERLLTSLQSDQP